MNSRVVIWLLAAGAFALALGPLTHHGESAASTIEEVAPPPKHNADAASQPELATSLELSVKKDVVFTLHVTNTSDSHVEINFPSGLTHDFIVYDSVGREVWRWSNGRMFTQTVRNKLLAGKETVSYEEHWKPVGRTGTFTAVARLESSNHPVEQRVEFTLP